MPAAPPSTDPRFRYRMRFGKIEDARWISHRDLARGVERWFRRASLPLSMTGGFHPTPRINIASALALGISGWNEVLEFELKEVLEAEQIATRLRETAPPGLVCHSVTGVLPGTAKVRVTSAVYSVELPPESRVFAEEGLRQFAAKVPQTVRREDRGVELDVHTHVLSAYLDDGVLKFETNLGLAPAIRPGEVLSAWGLGELLAEGMEIRREDVRVQE